jgi:hypothetical protein
MAYSAGDIVLDGSTQVRTYDFWYQLTGDNPLVNFAVETKTFLYYYQISGTTTVVRPTTGQLIPRGNT